MSGTAVLSAKVWGKLMELDHIDVGSRNLSRSEYLGSHSKGALWLVIEAIVVRRLTWPTPTAIRHKILYTLSTKRHNQPRRPPVYNSSPHNYPALPTLQSHFAKMESDPTPNALDKNLTGALTLHRLSQPTTATSSPTSTPCTV